MTQESNIDLNPLQKAFSSTAIIARTFLQGANDQSAERAKPMSNLSMAMFQQHEKYSGQPLKSDFIT
jgi:hypothetical protein